MSEASPIELVVKKLHADAVVPTRGSAHAAGYDLYALEDTDIKAQSMAVVRTGIAVVLPPGCYGRVAPRSGFTVKHSTDTGAGVIDPDYRGEIKVVVFNHNKAEYMDEFNGGSWMDYDLRRVKINKGDRIAQLILERYEDRATVRVVDEFDSDVKATERGASGFGSTGV